MRRSPTKEKEIYDSAKKMVENPKTQLPVSTIGIQARKKALRELRVTPAWRAAEIEAEKEAAESRVAEEAASAEAAAEMDENAEPDTTADAE